MSVVQIPNANRLPHISYAFCYRSTPPFRFFFFPYIYRMVRNEEVLKTSNYINIYAHVNLCSSYQGMHTAHCTLSTVTTVYPTQGPEFIWQQQQQQHTGQENNIFRIFAAHRCRHGSAIGNSHYRTIVNLCVCINTFLKTYNSTVLTTNQFICSIFIFRSA